MSPQNDRKMICYINSLIGRKFVILSIRLILFIRGFLGENKKLTNKKEGMGGKLVI